MSLLWLKLNISGVLAWRHRQASDHNMQFISLSCYEVHPFFSLCPLQVTHTPLEPAAGMAAQTRNGSPGLTTISAVSSNVSVLSQADRPSAGGETLRYSDSTPAHITLYSTCPQPPPPPPPKPSQKSGTLLPQPQGTTMGLHHIPPPPPPSRIPAAGASVPNTPQLGTVSTHIYSVPPPPPSPNRGSGFDAAQHGLASMAPYAVIPAPPSPPRRGATTLASEDSITRRVVNALHPGPDAEPPSATRLPMPTQALTKTRAGNTQAAQGDSQALTAGRDSRVSIIDKESSTMTAPRDSKLVLLEKLQEHNMYEDSQHNAGCQIEPPKLFCCPISRVSHVGEQLELYFQSIIALLCLVYPVKSCTNRICCMHLQHTVSYFPGFSSSHTCMNSLYTSSLCLETYV